MNEETRWQDRYEDSEISESPTLANFKTEQDALKGYLALNAWKGGAVSLPGDDATPEDISKFITKTKERVPNIAVMPNDDNPEDVKRFWGDLGVPDEKTGYNPKADAGVLDEELDKQIKDVARKSGLTDIQYQAFRQTYVDGTAELAEQNVVLKAEHDAQLKQHWGPAHDENMQVSESMAAKFQDADMPLGELNAAARIFMVNVAKSLSSDPQAFAQINNPKPGKTPADIRIDQDSLRKRLMSKTKPLNGKVRKEVLAKYNQTFIDLEPYE
jgi:hypothetical protein